MLSSFVLVCVMDSTWVGNHSPVSYVWVHWSVLVFILAYVYCNSFRAVCMIVVFHFFSNGELMLSLFYWWYIMFIHSFRIQNVPVISNSSYLIRFIYGGPLI